MSISDKGETRISKAKVKAIRSLHQKKYRELENLFIAEGPKVVMELLNSGFIPIEIYCTQQQSFAFADSAIQEVSERDLQSISALTHANQMLATFKIPEREINLNTLKDELVLALDDIRDPGNMGTIIRIADWFGINKILCSLTCVDVYNPKVIQSTMGSIARVHISHVDLEIILKNLQPVYATVLDGENIYAQKLSSTGVILIGNESNGISEKLIRYVSNRISIPNFGIHLIKPDSLNAAIATAIICSEFKRR